LYNALNPTEHHGLALGRTDARDPHRRVLRIKSKLRSNDVATTGDLQK
jgi:hypothetical protein